MAAISREVIKKIRDIQMHTTQLADDMMAGEWHSAFKGRGIEFEEVREYQTGDDIRTIDWNVTARMNHPYIKVFKEERELTVILAVDVSASCRFGSSLRLKQETMAEIGAILAFSAIKNNDKVGLFLFSDAVEKIVPPKKGTRHVLRVIRELLAYEPRLQGTNLETALTYLGTLQRKKAICFLISDFLCPLPTQALHLISKKHDLITIAVTDPLESAFPDVALATLHDLETGLEQTIDSGDASLRKKFKEQGQGRLDDLEQLMQKIRAGFVPIRTDESYIKPLRKFFKARRGRQ